MKKLVLSFVILLCANAVMAQQKYVWKQYNLSFTLPAGFRVVKSDANIFEAKGVGITFDLLAWNDPNVTATDIQDAVYHLAEEAGLTNISAAEEHDEDDFEGAFVVGSLKGKRTIFMGFIDKSSRKGTNFFAEIIYDKDDAFSQEDAFAILDSIHRMQ